MVSQNGAKSIFPGVFPPSNQWIATVGPGGGGDLGSTLVSHKARRGLSGHKGL